MKVVSQEHFLYFGACSLLPEWRKETPDGTGVETKTLKIIEGFVSKYSTSSELLKKISLSNSGHLSGHFLYFVEVLDSMNEDQKI